MTDDKLQSAIDLSDGLFAKFKPEAGRNWTYHQQLMLDCMGFYTFDHTAHANLTQTDKRALFYFLRNAYPRIMLSADQNRKTFRDLMLFPAIKRIYNEIEQSFRDKELKRVSWGSRLMEHQVESAALLHHRQHNLLALDQGLGKTLTAVTKSEVGGFGKTVVIAPAVAKWDWYYQLTDDWGMSMLYFSIIDSRKSQKAIGEKYILINFDMLKKHSDYLVFSCKTQQKIHLIIDECHNVKNPRTQRFKAIVHFLEAMAENNVEVHITLMSGTPIKNKVIDLFAYLKMVGHPLGENRSKFKEDFTHHGIPGVDPSERWRVRNVKRLRLLLSNFIIRRRKEDCLDLPSKLITKNYFELEDYQRAYEEVIERARADGSSIAAEGHLLQLLIVASLSKMAGIIDLAESLIEQGRKVVIFSGFRKPIAQLFHHFGSERSVYVTGKVQSKERALLARKFQSDPTVEAFVGQWQAAGVSLDLFASRDVIACDLPLTVAELHQGLDRVHRIGQNEQVNVFFMLAKGTIDEVVYNLIAKKADDINAVIDDNRKVTDYKVIPGDLLRDVIKAFDETKAKGQPMKVFAVKGDKPPEPHKNQKSLFKIVE